MDSPKFKVFDKVSIPNGGFHADKPAIIIDVEAEFTPIKYKVAVKINGLHTDELWVYEYDLEAVND